MLPLESSLHLLPGEFLFKNLLGFPLSSNHPRTFRVCRPGSDALPQAGCRVSSLHRSSEAKRHPLGGLLKLRQSHHNRPALAVPTLPPSAARPPSWELYLAEFEGVFHMPGDSLHPRGTCIQSPLC